MKLRVLIVVLAGIILGGLFFFLRPYFASAPHAAINEPKRFELTLLGGKNSVAPTTIQVMEGDTIILHVTSDEEGEVHIHGYDLKLELEKNISGDLQFVANVSGRFEYEFESSGALLGTIIVEPR